MPMTNRVNSGKTPQGQSRAEPRDRYEEGVTTIPSGSRAERPEAHGNLKRCGSCGATKPLSEFSKHAKKGYQYACKACCIEDKRMRRYGVTKDWYDKKMQEQGGACAVCGISHSDYSYGNKKHFSVDHDHTTGKPRGLLCNNCNVALGCLQDDPKIAVRAGKYLRTHRNKG